MSDPREEQAARLFAEIWEGRAPDAAAALAAAEPEVAEAVRQALAGMGRAHAELGAPAGGFTPHGGRQIGDFLLLRRLGSGGMGVVWEAEQISLRRRVALKLLGPDWQSHPQRHARFLREAEAGARLTHPGIVSVYALGECQGVHYIAQELVGGGRTLADELAEQRRAAAPSPRRDREIARRFADCAEALACAHQRGVLHRDLKPSNLLVDAGGRLRISDFGLARLLDSPALSRSGEISGTPYYMSPEQAAGRLSAVGPASDVFSLGATFYEALTLTRPFEGDSSEEVLHKVRTVDPVDPRRLHARIPRELAAVVLRALDKNPARRFPSAAEFAAELRRFLADQPLHTRPPGPLARARKWSRRHPVAAAAGAVALAGLSGVTLLWLDARSARARALAEARSAERVVAVLENLFLEAAPGEHAPGATPADLLRSGVNHLRGLADDPAAHARLLSTLSHVHWIMGEIEEAERLALQEAEVARSHFGAESPEHCVAWLDLAEVRARQERHEEAADYGGRAYRGLVRRAGPTDARSLRAASVYGQFLLRLGATESADALLTGVVATPEAALPRGSATWISGRIGLARVRSLQGRYAEAQGLLDEALAAAVERRGGDDPLVLELQSTMARILAMAGEDAAAIQRLEAVVAWHERRLGAAHPMTLQQVFTLGVTQVQDGQDEAAEANLRRARDGLHQAGYAAKADLAATQLAVLYLYQERWEEAAALLEPLAGAADRFRDDPAIHTLVRRLLGELRLGQGRPAAAETILAQLLAEMRAAGDYATPNARRVLAALVEVYRRQERKEEAAALLDEALVALRGRTDLGSSIVAEIEELKAGLAGGEQ